MGRWKVKSQRREQCSDVGTIRIRRRVRGDGSHYEKRYIKVRNGPPAAGRWIPLAKWTWEQTYGTDILHSAKQRTPND